MNIKGLIAGSTLALALGFTANAGTVVDLGGGWQATILSNNTLVDVTVDFVSLEDDVLVIEKFANFLTIDPFTGLPDPVQIAFNQVASDEDTVSTIVIADELIFNNTGIDWTGYLNVLLGSQATFDPVASAGFDVSPFSSLDFLNGNQTAFASGGVVADGDAWTPGAGPGGGELVINIDLSGNNPAKFVLKEIPIPAPGALALLGVAGLIGSRRRRN